MSYVLPQNTNLHWQVVILIISVFATACSSGPGLKSKGADQEEPIEEQAKNRKKEVKLPFLKENNAASVLTEYGASQTSSVAKVYTNMGEITIRLYDGTPVHRANFLMLANRKYYDNTLFYRIINNFMIQGGATDDFSIKSKQRRIGKYKLPAELFPEKYPHKRGVISMAREYENNPDKKSVSYEFFIIQGAVYNDLELDALERDEGLSLSPSERELYRTTGGAPHLDGEHTVFGEVVEGMGVVDKIAAVEVGEGDWPRVSVTIDSVRVVEID